MNPANYWIKKLQLQQHPEGGWFKETYRSQDIIPNASIPSYTGDRNTCTSIYYLLKEEEFSAFHRIKSDEIWHFHTGDSQIEILLILDGKLQKKILGLDADLQIIIPKNTWFAAHLTNKNGFALVACTVSPGFQFDDFELAQREQLLNNFPEYEKQIKQLTKP